MTAPSTASVPAPSEGRQQEQGRPQEQGRRQVQDVGDPGLFGPGSPSWRVHADPSMAVAGLGALLLQALHPVAMSGVEQFSGYREDPWGRLLRTAEFVGTVTYGSRRQAERAGARVRGLHRKFAGHEETTGEAFRVDDAELLRWVHCAEIGSFLWTTRAAGLRLSGAEADAYVAEQRQVARLVGLEPATVPGTDAELAAYFRAVRPRLRSTPASRRVLAFVVAPPMPTRVAWGTPARAAWASVATLAVASLPGWARRLHGVPAVPGDGLPTSAALRALRVALLAVPVGLREGPHLSAARERLGLAPGEGT